MAKRKREKKARVRKRKGGERGKREEGLKRGGAGGFWLFGWTVLKNLCCAKKCILLPSTPLLPPIPQ